MSTAKKSPAARCNGDQAAENLATGLSTDHSTRTAPKPRKPKYRTWHVDAGRTSDGRAKGICGWVSPGRNFLTSSAGPKKNDECIPRQCPDCAAIVEMQRDAVKRRARAEAITEMVLRHLENGEI